MERPATWDAVWTLCSRRGERLQPHVALTRFAHEQSFPLGLLAPGKYVLHVYARQSAEAEPASTGASKPPGKTKTALRTALQTATFGQFGRLEVNAEVRTFCPTSGKELSRAAAGLSPRDEPAAEMRLVIDDTAPAPSAVLALSSTSTVTALHVAATLFRERPRAVDAERSSAPGREFKPSQSTLKVREAQETQESAAVAAAVAAVALGLSDASIVSAFVALVALVGGIVTAIGWHGVGARLSEL